MSWFKSDNSGERAMSNAVFEARAARLPSTAERPSDFDVKSPSRTAPASRATATPTPEVKVASPPEAQGSVLGATLVFKGELRADEDFVLQGRVEGSIQHSKNLTIGTEGFVKGDSRASTIIVDGTIEGDLYALDSISLRATAKVQGNLLAPRISIADGATFNGKVDMASATRAVRHMSGRQASLPEERTVEHILTGTDTGPV
jgi:cytoskeletal protein CcmA (bactofilin family)